MELSKISQNNGLRLRPHFASVRGIVSQGIKVALSISLLLTPLGCATTRSFSSPISEDIRKNCQHVTVIPAGFIPSTNLLTFAKGKKTGAAKGAAAGALEGLIASAKGGAGAGPYGAAVIILLLPVFVSIGAIAGGIEGAINATPGEEVAKIETTVNRALQELDMQNTMAENIASKGMERTSYRFVPLKGRGSSTPDAKPDFTSFKGDGTALALEVGVLEFGFHAENGRDPLLTFFMNARIRAFRHDGEVLHADIFKYTSQKRKFSEWVENGALRLREALGTGYAEIAEAAIEKMFLLYEVKIDSTWSSATKHCMLEPLYPPQERYGLFSHQLNFPKIDTLHPTLKWESFPRDKDWEADRRGILNSVSDITYELKVWKGKAGIPEELIYSRSGLPLPEHTIETPLQLKTEYFWVVRSRFKLDGQERLTRWAYSRIPGPPLPDPCHENLIPLDHYHRFKITSK